LVVGCVSADADGTDIEPSPATKIKKLRPWLGAGV